MTHEREFEQTKCELLTFLQEKSVFHGDFTLSSGAKSSFYVDCKLTTYHPQGAWLVGQVMHRIIRRRQEELGVTLNGIGGLTMGADPIALAVGMVSHWLKDPSPLLTFSVRKTPKSYGQTKLIEGNFRKGDSVVVIDDVVTRGESTLKAIDAVLQEGGKIPFVAVLMDREEGGREKIEARGFPVIAAFNRQDLFGKDVKAQATANVVTV
jgi:orotate phosphoribosyltransferase